MIVVDTGPLVALFDPADGFHQQCAEKLRGVAEPLVTTVPVLTEALYMLTPGSRGSAMLRLFIERSGISIWFFDAHGLARAFALMEEYASHPMDFADASLVAAAEALRVCKVMTVDRRDFGSYRVRIGHNRERFEIA